MHWFRQSNTDHSRLSEVTDICIWIALILHLLLTPITVEARCLSINVSSHPCRYPVGDNWCKEHNLPQYAYRDKCKSHSLLDKNIHTHPTNDM